MVDFLYHYTTIQNLALILKNKTLRLMPLNLMDDLQETKSKDIQNFGQFVYVSSWTDKAKEVIPMWKMYTKPECGVRIGLIKNPFQIIDNATNKFRDPTQSEYMNSKDKNTEGIYPIIHINEMMPKNCIIANMGLNQQLTQVKYCHNPEELEPQIISLNKDTGNLEISLGKLGNTKNEYWRFQQEWRYIIRTQPFSIPRSFKSFDGEMTKYITELLTGAAKQSLPYIDLHLSSYALETMEILLAPDMPEGNKILVDSLIEKYNPQMKYPISESCLTGLLR